MLLYVGYSFTDTTTINGKLSTYTMVWVDNPGWKIIENSNKAVSPDSGWGRFFCVKVGNGVGNGVLLVNQGVMVKKNFFFFIGGDDIPQKKNISFNA